MMSAQGLIWEVHKDRESRFGCKPSEWEYVDRHGRRGTVIGLGSTWNALDAFKPSSKYVPRNEDDAENRQFAAGDRMSEQLDTAFDAPNAIQSSGPIILLPDHGVSQLICPCTHPLHADNARLFFATMLIPMLILANNCKDGLMYVIHVIMTTNWRTQMAQALRFQ